MGCPALIEVVALIPFTGLEDPDEGWDLACDLERGHGGRHAVETEFSGNALKLKW